MKLSNDNEAVIERMISNLDTPFKAEARQAIDLAITHIGWAGVKCADGSMIMSRRNGLQFDVFIVPTNRHYALIQLQ